jgi:hypothetical protein
MSSTCFGDQVPKISHLVHQGKGGLAGEIADLRKDADAAFIAFEGRDATLLYPELDYVDGVGPSAAGADMVLVGRTLLQSQTFASVTLGASLDIVVREPGVAGNLESVEVVDSGGGGLAVTYAARRLEIDLGGAVPDEDTIATAVNNAAVGSPMRANSGGGAAFGLAAEVPLAGGVGAGWSCTVGGFAAPIKFDTGAAVSSVNLSETQVIVTVPALAPIIATDKAKIYVTTDSVRTDLGAVAVIA